jgi:hypothetical protein
VVVDRTTFTDLVRQNGRPDDVAVLERIFAWASAHDLEDTWESGPEHGDSWVPSMRRVEWDPVPIGIEADPPRLFVSGELLRRHHPFRTAKRWQVVLERLYEIPGVVQTEQGNYPNILLHDLVASGTWSTFSAVIEDMMSEIRRSAERGNR